MTEREVAGRHAGLAAFGMEQRLGPAIWREAWWGEMRVGYETYLADYDDAALLKGCPEGRCQCPHWGYLAAGQMTVRYPDHEDVVRAGELYYMAPGHTMKAKAGTVLIEFSPAEEFRQLMEAAGAEVQRLRGEAGA